MVILYTLYTERTNRQDKKKHHGMPKSIEILVDLRALGFILCKEDYPNVYKNRIRFRIRQKVFKRLTLENGIFSANLYNLYTQFNSILFK
jgi:hypothetical protein